MLTKTEIRGLRWLQPQELAVLRRCTEILVLFFLQFHTQLYKVVIRMNNSVIQYIYSAKRIETQQEPRAT